MSQITQKTILVVDDDVSVTTSLKLLLKQNGFQSLEAHSPNEALSILQSKPIDLVIQDMNFSRKTTGEEGMELLKAIKQQNTDIPVLLMTAWGSIELAVEGIKLGAKDFITKPWDNQRLIQTIETSLSLIKNNTQTTMSREQLDKDYDFSDIIGEHPALLKVLTTVARVSKTDAPVIILGESGTGKELIADALHKNSKRINEAMVKVNLGGINSSLFDSEMFGHVKGAFTDAKTDRKGRFELANGGSIFLDEVGDLDKSSQVKLLRVLQDQTYQAVGSSINQRTNVRVISATNCDLETMVENNEFREDLLYRINLITLTLPPLRERKSDIKLLVNDHLTKIEKMYGLEKLIIDEQAMQWLNNQEWPGNIRQLKQSVERAVLMSGQNELTIKTFMPDQDDNQNQSTTSTNNLHNLTLDEAEKMMIENALKMHHNNITRVANALGISRAALYRRLEKFEISV